MAMEKFKMCYTYSLSGSLNNGTMSGRAKMYQRETIFGKIDNGATVPFKSLSFANGETSISAEADNILFTITLQNKDLIIEAELLEGASGFTTEMSLSDVLSNLPTIFDENGSPINSEWTYVTANNNTMPYISIPNLASEGGSPK